jgi:hypothetical protein
MRFDELEVNPRGHGPFDKLRVNGVGKFGLLSTTPPFGLSLSKARDLRSGPFDKLRANGRWMVFGSHTPHRSA